jgi:uncharacterized delta-60 repeat protein
MKYSLIILGLCFYGHLIAQEPGTLDLSFGDGNTQGYVELDVSAVAGKVVSQIGPDGKIYLTGKTASKILIIRLLPDGEYDTSFGGDGILELSFGNTQYCGDILLLESGELLVGYSSYDDSYYLQDFSIIKLDSGGDQILEYGYNGVANYITGISNTMRDMVLHDNNRIVFCGHGYLEQGLGWIVSSVDEFGFNDFDFSLPQQQFNSEYVHTAGEMVVLSDSRVAVAGYSGSVATLVMLTSNGEFDVSFGDEGVVLLAGENNYASAVIDRNLSDQILISVLVYEDDLYHTKLFLYEPNSTLNQEFGESGMVEFVETTNNVGVNDIKFQPNGYAVICGSKVNIMTDSISPFIMRILPDGSMDTAFGSFGMGEIVEEYSGMFYTDCGFQNEDKIIAVGRKNDKLVVARYHSGGMLLNHELESSKMDISVQPNPFENFFQVKIPENLLGDVVFTLTDLQGRHLENKRNRTNDVCDFDVRDLPAGMYLLSVANGIVHKEFRLVKQ